MNIYNWKKIKTKIAKKNGNNNDKTNTLFCRFRRNYDFNKFFFYRQK